jgi:hypothetical protein
MSSVSPVWQKREVSPEMIQNWQAALNAGRQRYYDLERRATYPAETDEDTLTLAEHYRLKYPHARILKALSFYIDVTPAELSAVTGIHKALLSMEVRRVADRLRMSVYTVRRRDNAVISYRLGNASDRDEIRAVVCSNWLF